MSFATNELIRGRIAVVMTSRSIRRLAPGLAQHVNPRRDFGLVALEQPLQQVIGQLVELNPVGILMEYRESLTEAVCSLKKPTTLVLADMLVEGVGCVNVDDYALGCEAGTYLKSKGLGSFARMGFNRPHAPEQKRGFADALRIKSPPKDLEIENDGLRPTQLPKTRRVLEKWLQGLPKPVGIFAEEAELGREIVDACHRMSLRVPGDIALLAVSDEAGSCELTYPALSSIEVPWTEIGFQAGNLLERQLRGERVGEPLLIPPGGIRTRGSSDFYRLSDHRIQEAAHYMQDACGQPIDVAAVATKVGLNRRTLERLFREELNTTPKQVLTEIRTRQAREMLDQTALRIGEIAERCGFTSSENLARAFRRHFRVTPGNGGRSELPSAHFKGLEMVGPVRIAAINFGRVRQILPCPVLRPFPIGRDTDSSSSFPEIRKLKPRERL